MSIWTGFDVRGRKITKITNPFSDKAKSVARSCDYFKDRSKENHIYALKQGTIGLFLAEFAEKHNIEIRVHPDQDEIQADGVYFHDRASRDIGHIELGPYLNALLLGHEIRHAWQAKTLPAEVLNPLSPDELILVERFIEADGRAIQFGVTLQIVHKMHKGNEYANNLLGCLDDYEKEILEYSFEKLDELCANREKLKQAMRQAFDWWIANAPLVPPKYDEMTERQLNSARTSKIYRKLFSLFNGGLSAKPCFSYTGVSPAFMDKLVSSLGELGEYMDGNYLTDTKGPDFMSEFYLRHCSHFLEKAADQYKGDLKEYKL